MSRTARESRTDRSWLCSLHRVELPRDSRADLIAHSLLRYDTVRNASCDAIAFQYFGGEVIFHPILSPFWSLAAHSSLPKKCYVTDGSCLLLLLRGTHTEIQSIHREQRSISGLLSLSCCCEGCGGELFRSMYRIGRKGKKKMHKRQHDSIENRTQQKI